jgi:diguanylate cyclase (GGDEF)-like protein
MWTIAGSEGVMATEYDALTRLPNHQSLAAGLARMLDAPPLHHDIGALLLLDVDHFHVTNEVLGHAAGDQLLRDVAAGLRSWARGRCLLARTGADQFAIALTAEAGEDFRSLAAGALAAVTSACMPNPPQFSVGVSNFDHGRAPTVNALLKCASAALRDAKQDGGGRIVRYGIGERYGTDGAEWVARALTEDRLILMAQPIVDVRKGEVHRRELLVRALDGDGQLVMPGAFIPVAERFGLMPALDRWVVARALALAAEGHRLSVNLSAQSLTDITPLAALVRSFVAKGVNPDNLMFEVTETAAISDLGAGLAGLRALAALGCPLALDDFGAGFGCFNYLKHVPAQIVKIDREFIRDISTDGTDLAITTAIAKLAHQLGMDVVAEGIEDRETLEMVTSAGIRYAQGYFVGRPTAMVPGGPLSRLPMPSPEGTAHTGEPLLRGRSRITDRRALSRNATRALPADH